MAGDHFITVGVKNDIPLAWAELDLSSVQVGGFNEGDESTDFHCFQGLFEVLEGERMASVITVTADDNGVLSDILEVRHPRFNYLASLSVGFGLRPWHTGESNSGDEREDEGREDEGSLLGCGTCEHSSMISGHRVLSDMTIMTPALNFNDPWTGIDRGPYTRSWIALSVLFLMGPFQILALSIGVWTGFTTGDHTLLRWALVLSVVFMLANIFLYHRVSKICDERTWAVNRRMWDTISESVQKKYGPGTLTSADHEPKKVGPPDGSNGFWAKLDRAIFGGKCKVMWIPQGKDYQFVMLSITPGTFEPVLEELPQKGSKKPAALIPPRGSEDAYLAV